MEWEVSLIDIRDTGKLGDFDSGHVFEMDNVEIKDHETLERIYVKAQFCKDPSKLPDGEVLWVRNYTEEIIPQSGKIKILGKIPTPYDE
ncbi:hypothetical protein ACFLV1_02030 [Chloroflexota bacterium]